MSDSVTIGGSKIPGDAWVDGVQSVEFKALLDAKRRVIVPMIVVFVVCYMGLSVLSGFARGFLGEKVFGPINLGFVLIGVNYVMSWTIAVVYARISASTHDPLVKVIVEKSRANGRPQ